ncbi:DNA-directed RNA polymerase sigma-70 factor [Pectobacterium araliae]|uniref:RNA polymerase sigma factor n=1 Tax=Pectobacterium araliae TaxID=3073862 RepID=A0AAN0KI62_9GAMM|nr:RNA polymerase sigma factor [Pectobacterium sp. MAFF 302110]GKW18333.1 DNA-directed RNA polymerase sigma-70 factor [Pectobacterium carotovorum subsp. carotovorum]
MLASNNVVDVFVDIHSMLQRIVAYRTGSKHVAQDLTQEMYFRVLGLTNTFPTYDDARNYLIRIALNAATDHVRTEQRHTQLLGGAIQLFENYEPSPEEGLYVKQQIIEIDNALADLPQKCRDVLYLSRIEGMTHEEIAEKLGVSRSLVEKYAIRALLHCREHLKAKREE